MQFFMLPRVSCAVRWPLTSVDCCGFVTRSGRVSAVVVSGVSVGWGGGGGGEGGVVGSLVLIFDKALAFIRLIKIMIPNKFQCNFHIYWLLNNKV
jgi:hypothetical protein